jgi:hypothetical protein
VDVKQHLHDRRLNPDLYNVSWDEETACFLLWNLSGQLVGYQQYRPFADKTVPNNPKLGRYFTYSKNNISVWGLETYHWRNDVLFVTEGIFDACKLHNQGLPAIAVLSNNPKQLKPWLGSLPRLTISVCDNDDAGKRLANVSDMAIFCEGDKDLGDMTQHQVVDFLTKNKVLTNT